MTVGERADLKAGRLAAEHSMGQHDGPLACWVCPDCRSEVEHAAGRHHVIQPSQGRGYPVGCLCGWRNFIAPYRKDGVASRREDRMSWFDHVARSVDR